MFWLRVLRDLNRQLMVPFFFFLSCLLAWVAGILPVDVRHVRVLRTLPAGYPQGESCQQFVARRFFRRSCFAQRVFYHIEATYHTFNCCVLRPVSRAFWWQSFFHSSCVAPTGFLSYRGTYHTCILCVETRRVSRVLAAPPSNDERR